MIRVSHAATLGLHAMAYLARRGGKRVPMREIARGMGVSEAHMAKVMGRLERAGLVQGARGPGGGYALGRSPSQLTLKDVFEALEGPFRTTKCLFGRPSRCGACILGNLLWRIDGAVDQLLRKTRLSDLKVRIEDLVRE